MQYRLSLQFSDSSFRTQDVFGISSDYLLLQNLLPTSIDGVGSRWAAAWSSSLIGVLLGSERVRDTSNRERDSIKKKNGTAV